MMAILGQTSDLSKIDFKLIELFQISSKFSLSLNL